MPDIRIRNLRKQFGDVVAVRDIDISFPTATVTCLLGPSGCGKTTLLRLIAGLEEPTAGDIYFDNDRVTELPPGRRNIGMVFQYPVVYRGLNVYRNIELPLMEEKISTQERKKRTQEVISLMGLGDSVGKNITQLDNSTRQKVAVARAVARQPSILLFDEPLTNVDVTAKAQLKQALKKLTSQIKQTIIYVTHDQTEAMTLADQIALMNQGVIFQRDEPRALYTHPNDVFGGWFLGNPGMNFVEAEIEASGGSPKLRCPLFPSPVKVSGDGKQARVTVGIRPEHIGVSEKRHRSSVEGRIAGKAISVGGQYLLMINVGEAMFKAKVRPHIGQKAREKVWVEAPLDYITLFGENGRRLEVNLCFSSG